MDTIVAFFTNKPLLTQILFLAVSGALAHFIIHLVYRHLFPKLEKRGNHWQAALIKSAYSPLILYIWSLIITSLLQTILKQFGFNNGFTSSIPTIRQVLALVFFLWFAMSFIRNVEVVLVQRLAVGKKRFRDKTAVNAMSQLLRVILIIVILLIGMQTIGLKISTILTFGGIGGIAIGFAAKDSLANFFGGMMIYWDRPFVVGEWISSPDKQIEGTVENIGWRLTRIRTFDKRPLYVPNGIFSNISVENPSRMLNRRIKTTMGIRYDDAGKVGDIVKDIDAMLHAHPEIDTKQTCFVRLVEFAHSSLNILIYTFTKTTNWIKFQEVQEDVFLKIISIVEQHEAEFAFPTNTVHIPQGIDFFQNENNGEEDDQRLQ